MDQQPYLGEITDESNDSLNARRMKPPSPGVYEPPREEDLQADIAKHLNVDFTEAEEEADLDGS